MRYNEKTYNKNTRILCNRMSELAYRVPWGDVRQLLNKVILEIEKYPYTKTDGKAQKAIDERIFGLVQKMTDDYKQGKHSRCLKYGILLLSAIIDARQFGKERYDAKTLAMQEKLAWCRGSLRDAYDQATAIEKQRAELRRQAAKLQQGSAEYWSLAANYNRLREEYDFAIKSVQKFEKQMIYLQRRQALVERMELMETIASIGIISAEDLAKSNVGLDAKIAADRAKKAYDSIQGSTPVGSSASDDCEPPSGMSQQECRQDLSENKN